MNAMYFQQNKKYWPAGQQTAEAEIYRASSIKSSYPMHEQPNSCSKIKMLRQILLYDFIPHYILGLSVCITMIKTRPGNRLQVILTKTLLFNHDRMPFDRQFAENILRRFQ